MRGWVVSMRTGPGISEARPPASQHQTARKGRMSLRALLGSAEGPLQLHPNSTSVLTFWPPPTFSLRPSVVWGLPRCLSGKEPTCQRRRHKRYRFHPWVGKIPWRRKRKSTPIFLPGESHGWRSLLGYSPGGCKELDTNEHIPNCYRTLQSRNAESK